MADTEQTPRPAAPPATGSTDPDLIPWYLREDGITSRADIAMFGLLMGGVLLAIGLVALYALLQGL